MMIAAPQAPMYGHGPPIQPANPGLTGGLPRVGEGLSALFLLILGVHCFDRGEVRRLATTRQVKLSCSPFGIGQTHREMDGFPLAIECLVVGRGRTVHATDRSKSCVLPPHYVSVCQGSASL
jgi:hypothetical protein